ncbi:metabotropic glutamate receptor-like protein N [Elysia marginata]|uniref:Metabotropic glutamate receptor-like protein N n=1 Tax=Elysia marginata TaxID=1093978 RepID=A0AAV4FXP2_9GAST|nr:metabotropic glutamate receptor-like protein N [Elysia marginata]
MSVDSLSQGLHVELPSQGPEPRNPLVPRTECLPRHPYTPTPRRHHDTTTPRHHDTTTPRHHDTPTPRHPDTPTTPRHHDDTTPRHQDAFMAVVRSLADCVDKTTFRLMDGW